MSTVRKDLKDLPPVSQKRLDELAAIPDEQIDYSDIPELDDDFWENAEIRGPDEQKRLVSLRLEPDVVEWFKNQGKGYTSRMAAILKHFYEHHRHSDPKPGHEG